MLVVLKDIVLFGFLIVSIVSVFLIVGGGFKSFDALLRAIVKRWFNDGNDDDGRPQ